MFFGGCARRLKPVPHPRLGQDVARMRGVFLNFLAQLVYHHAKVLCFLSVIRCTRRVPHLGEFDVFIVLPFRRISKLRGISGTQNSDSFRLHQICRAWVSPRSPNCLVASGQWRAARSKQDVLQTQSPNRAAARTFAFAASSSRFLGSAFVSSEWRKRLETAVISSIPARNAASFAFAGLLKPLIFLTNCNEAARTSSDVTGGSKLKSVLIFLHIPITSTRFDQTLCVSLLTAEIRPLSFAVTGICFHVVPADFVALEEVQRWRA